MLTLVELIHDLRARRRGRAGPRAHQRAVRRSARAGRVSGRASLRREPALRDRRRSARQPRAGRAQGRDHDGAAGVPAQRRGARAATRRSRSGSQRPRARAQHRAQARARRADAERAAHDRARAVLDDGMDVRHPADDARRTSAACAVAAKARRAGDRERKELRDARRRCARRPRQADASRHEAGLGVHRVRDPEGQGRHAPDRRAAHAAAPRAARDPHKILGKVPMHDACHGFVAGRSTVTNATPHVGAALILKVDLRDFFPTIHYRRVRGLFRWLGYSETVAKHWPDRQHIGRCSTTARSRGRACCRRARRRHRRSRTSRAGGSINGCPGSPRRSARRTRATPTT